MSSSNTDQQDAYILVTGGAGFIGSHTVVELLQSQTPPPRLVVLDNFSNSTPKVFERVERITGHTVEWVKGDITKRGDVDRVFEKYKISMVLHFAGLKAVGESAQKPLLYYKHNVAGTITLLEAMEAHGVKQLVFSSSATVYGIPDELPVSESAPVRTTNPYGRTKAQVEDILKDVVDADPSWKIIMLRYFNPVGAHPSGLMGEDPSGPPNNIAPFIAQVAIGLRPKVYVFGDDYPTRDGTGVRDFIHIVDLAQGHLAAIQHLGEVEGCTTYNLGTGRGYSVLEFVKEMRKASGREIPVECVARRAGDVGEVLADGRKAEREMGWRGERGIEEVCRDLWLWQSTNPKGYEG